MQGAEELAEKTNELYLSLSLSLSVLCMPCVVVCGGAQELAEKTNEWYGEQKGRVLVMHGVGGEQTRSHAFLP